MGKPPILIEVQKAIIERLTDENARFAVLIEEYRVELRERAEKLQQESDCRRAQVQRLQTLLEKEKHITATKKRESHEAWRNHTDWCKGQIATLTTQVAEMTPAYEFVQAAVAAPGAQGGVKVCELYGCRLGGFRDVCDVRCADIRQAWEDWLEHAPKDVKR